LSKRNVFSIVEEFAGLSEQQVGRLGVRRQDLLEWAADEYRQRLASSSSTTSKKRIREERPSLLGKEKPKRPMSSYLIYAGEQRPVITTSHPDWKQKEIMKEIAVMWKALPADQLAVYAEKAKEKKAEYMVKLAEWEKDNPDGEDKTATKRKTTKAADPKKPKKEKVMARPSQVQIDPRIRAEALDKSTRSKWKLTEIEGKGPQLFCGRCGSFLPLATRVWILSIV